MPANLENSTVAAGLEKVSFHFNPKEWRCQRMFKLSNNCTHLICQQRKAQRSPSQASTVCELQLPDVQAGFRKGRRTRDQTANICWIIEKSRVPEKHLLLLYLLPKAFDCVDHHKLWKILQEMGIPDHLTCLLRNLYAGQEATVRTGHGTTDWCQIRKGVRQGCILSPCLFKFYAE